MICESVMIRTTVQDLRRFYLKN